MLAKLFQEFMQARAEYYEGMKDKIGGLKLHVPILIVKDGERYALAALLHGLWAIYLGGPVQILQVSGKGVEYIKLEDKETKSLAHWKGPLYDQAFVENEERLLEISVPVFDHYLKGSGGDLVLEYARMFQAITPPEFIPFYERLNAHFMGWLKQMGA
jgi:hypothetical protein